MSKIKDLIEQLNSIKLDKSLIIKLNTLKEDSVKRKEVIDNAFKAVGSKQGLWTISIGVSLLVTISVIPLLLKELNKNKELMNQYKYESKELDIISRELKLKNIEEIELKNKITILETYLANSSKIIYLPEVIRLSLEKNNVELISFKPIKTEEDEMSYPDPQENMPIDETNTNEVIPPDYELNEIDMENKLTDNPEVIEPKKLIFNITARGDYLKALESLKDFQEYKSFVLFEKVIFTKEVSDTNNASTSGDGQIIMEFTIAIPTNQSG